MRFFTSFLILIIASLITCSAYAVNYPSARIKRYAVNTPRKVENNLNKLVKHLVEPLDDDYDKAKIIAFWIASHINYDEYLYNGTQTTKLAKNHHLQSPDKLLESRVGICSEFSLLYEEMCRIAGVPADIIKGYAYPSRYHLNKRQKKNYAHSWNYFVYKGKKVYVDTTFMAKGVTAPSGRATDMSHKRALRKVERDNRYKSIVNDFDEYYFDFNYKNEIKNMYYKHVEK